MRFKVGDMITCITIFTASDTVETPNQNQTYEVIAIRRAGVWLKGINSEDNQTWWHIKCFELSKEQQDKNAKLWDTVSE